MNAMRTYVWRDADLRRAWDKLTDFAKDTAAYVNSPRDSSEIADGAITQSKLAPVHALSLYTDVAQAIANATTTPIVWTLNDFTPVGDSVVYDRTSQVASVKRAGFYRVTLRVGIQAAVAAAGRISAIVQVNASDVDEACAGAVLGSPIVVQCSGVYRLAEGDTITGCARQSTTAAQVLLTTAPHRARMQIDYVGGL